jgi:predicted ATPase/transcriptional regulator with XRE-family HTH domain
LDPPGSFNEWFKLRRKSLDLTQEELAQRAGCSVFALRKIETGERRPSKQLASLLAQALEIPPDDRQTFTRVARGELNIERLRQPFLTPTPFSSATGLPPEPAFSPPPCQLPVQAVPLVGRQPEMAALERLFGDPQCRLLTLTGLGGMGKTRLAVEFASSQLSMFPGGIYYVSLASLGSPELIIPAIAEVFGFGFSGPSEPMEQLLNYLAGRTHKELLLVLDNLEHLLGPSTVTMAKPDAAMLVMELLQRLPNLKILATSRERLNLQGEWMFELHGLPAPPLDFNGRLDDFGAVTLFTFSARRVRPDFEISPAEQSAVIRICSLLEGIPLAVELAAAWVSLLSLDEIAAEIASSLDFLSTSMRDVPARHRSIRATFDHSWRLLSEAECRTLQRLAVFHGGFTRQAAAQIAGASLPVLSSLHAKSLIRHPESGRYDLHEVIRQYAISHFENDPERDEILDRYAAYYFTLLKDREPALKSDAQHAAIRELSVEMDNVRAAWSWAVQRQSFGWIAKALDSFGWLCDIAGWLGEGIELMEPVVQALRARAAEDEQKILGHTLAQQGLLYFRKGRFDQAQAAWGESLVILRPFGDAKLLTLPLIYNSILCHLMGDMDTARALLEEGLACARAAGDRWAEAYAIFNQGYIASLTGHYADGYERMLDGLACWRQLGDPSSIALGLNYIASTAIQLGYLLQAQSYLEESLALCGQVGDRWGMGTAYRNLGLTALAQGQPVEAQILIRKSLDIFGEYIVGWDIARSQTYLGDAMLMADDLACARNIYPKALRVALEACSTPVALDALIGLARLHQRDGEVKQAYELACFVLQHPAGVLITRENAAQLVLQVGRDLDPQTIQAIEEQASHLTIETIAQAVSDRVQPS